MVRQYQEENVYEALQERFHFLFQELTYGRLGMGLTQSSFFVSSQGYQYIS